MFEFVLFLSIFLMGAYYIMEMYCPGVFAQSYTEIKGVTTSFSSAPGLIATFFYNAGVFALGLPDQVMQGISGQ